VRDEGIHEVQERFLKVRSSHHQNKARGELGLHCESKHNPEWKNPV